MTLSPFTLADPKLVRDAFDREDFFVELKMDGFRALAYVGANETQLVSKNGHTMKRFAKLVSAIERDLRREAVLDGEIVVLDSDGRPRFYDLLLGVVSPCSTPSTCYGSMGRTCASAVD